MKKQPTTKAVTTRFSISDHMKLLQIAENKGSTVGDVIRESWRHYQQRQHIEQQLLQLEQRLKYSTFETLISITNLDEKAKQNAIEKLKLSGIEF